MSDCLWLGSSFYPRCSVDRTASQPSSPWPVSARSLLTKRERALYDSLIAVYPTHRLFIQVALSQLVDVQGNHPEWAATRNRIDKLVADFVLCLPDLTVVAVIELDDWRRKLSKRAEADARKTKALSDAGLRLIRIPDGPLPSVAALRDLIDHPQGSSATPFLAQCAASVPHLRPVEDETSVSEVPLSSDHEWQAQKAVWRGALKVVLAGAVLIGGWYVYMHVIPQMVQNAFQPLASKPKPTAAPAPHTPPASAPVISHATAATTPGASRVELEAKSDADFQATQTARTEKQVAWTAFFNLDPACDHPVDWKAQVDCGNQYMRGKQAFEAQWARAHGGSVAPSTVVIDNNSFEKPRRK